MPAERLSMRKIQEVLRLHAAGHSQPQIARSCGIGRMLNVNYFLTSVTTTF